MGLQVYNVDSSCPVRPGVNYTKEPLVSLLIHKAIRRIRQHHDSQGAHVCTL